jgi:hypothetical protein
MIKRKEIIKFILALLIIALLIYYLYANNYFIVISKVSALDFLFLTSLTLLSYFASGLQMYYLIKKQNNISISVADTLFLPLSMSLFSYIIPTNGGLLYSVFFLKKKYKIDSTKSFSIGIFSIYISFFITGVFGVFSCIYSEKYNFWMLSISFALIFLPFIINVINKYFQRIKSRNGSLLNKLLFYLNSVVVHSNNFIQNKEVIFVNLIINLIYLVLSLLTYQLLNIILEAELPLTSIFVIILITRVSSLIRLLPGNLGLEELYTGGIFKLIGRDPGIGIVFSLILRFTTIILFIPFGILHTLLNTKFFKFKDFNNLGIEKKINGT